MPRKALLLTLGAALAALGLALPARAVDLKGTDPRTGRPPVVPPPPPSLPVAKEAGCGNHGTAVEFTDSVTEAARQAQKEQKLVFVLHVSGHFEDPRFT